MQENLILVANPLGMDTGDFEEITEIVSRENRRVLAMRTEPLAT